MDRTVMDSSKNGLAQTTVQIATGIFLVSATVVDKTIHHYCTPPEDSPTPEMEYASRWSFLPRLQCLVCGHKYGLWEKEVV